MKNLLVLIFLGVVSVSRAQEWQEYYEDDTLLIEFATVDYKSRREGVNHQRLVFRYINKIEKELTLKFDRELTYDGPLLENYNDSYSVRISPHDTLSYGRKHRENEFYVFIRDYEEVDEKSLSAFRIINISYL